MNENHTDKEEYVVALR